MAYTDLIDSQVTLVGGGAGGQYAFAFDLPQAADSSPHLTHMGILLDLTAAAGAFAPVNGMSNIVTSLRVKIDSTVIIDWNNNAAAAPGVLSQLGVLIQRLGGSDYCTADNNAAATCIAEIMWPVGIPANVPHRVNVNITLGNENANMSGQNLAPAGSTMSVSTFYGVSTERTVIGSRQDYTMSPNTTRQVVTYGKDGFNMLGVFATSNINTTDQFTRFRVNNGAFRELDTMQWRALNNSFGGPDPTSLRLGNIGVMAADGSVGRPTDLSGQGGSLFLNLRRLSAGASADIAVTYGAIAAGTDQLALYPVWVAPVSSKSGAPVRQTIVTPQSTTKTVEENAN